MHSNILLKGAIFSLLISIWNPTQATTATSLAIFTTVVATLATTVKVYYDPFKKAVFNCYWDYKVGWDPSYEIDLIIPAAHISHSQGKLANILFNTLWNNCDKSNIAKHAGGFRFLFEKSSPADHNHQSFEAYYFIPYDRKHMDVRGSLLDIDDPYIQSFFTRDLHFFKPEVKEEIQNLYYSQQIIFARIGNDIAVLLGWNMQPPFTNEQDNVLMLYFEKDSARGQLPEILKNKRTIVIEGQLVDVSLMQESIPIEPEPVFETPVPVSTRRRASNALPITEPERVTRRRTSSIHQIREAGIEDAIRLMDGRDSGSQHPPLTPLASPLASHLQPGTVKRMSPRRPNARSFGSTKDSGEYYSD